MKISINDTTKVVLKCVVKSMIVTRKTVNLNGNGVILLSKILSSPTCSCSNITIKKAKQLRIKKINFQSIWKKRKKYSLPLLRGM